MDMLDGGAPSKQTELPGLLWAAYVIRMSEIDIHISENEPVLNRGSLLATLECGYRIVRKCRQAWLCDTSTVFKHYTRQCAEGTRKSALK
jgi:hypothetical protein